MRIQLTALSLIAAVFCVFFAYFRSPPTLPSKTVLDQGTKTKPIKNVVQPTHTTEALPTPLDPRPGVGELINIEKTIIQSTKGMSLREALNWADNITNPNQYIKAIRKLIIVRGGEDAAGIIEWYKLKLASGKVEREICAAVAGFAGAGNVLTESQFHELIQDRKFGERYFRACLHWGPEVVFFVGR